MNEAASAGRPYQPGTATPVFGGRYLSITSYKRDGRGVATPVWFVQRDGRLLVETDATSGKIKRIRRNPQVRVAVCTASGRLRGQQMSAEAEILPDSETGAIERHHYRHDAPEVLSRHVPQVAQHGDGERQRVPHASSTEPRQRGAHRTLLADLAGELWQVRNDGRERHASRELREDRRRRRRGAH